MPFHLLACSDGANTSSVLLTRLLLPAGYSTDDLGDDLRTHYPDLQAARALCASERPLRGLPSERCTLSDSERDLLPPVKTSVANYKELVEASEAIDAVSVHVFANDTWKRVRDEFNMTDLVSMKLFRVEEPAARSPGETAGQP